MSDDRRVPDEVPTLAEMVESCRHNAEVADWQVRAVRKRLAGLMPGPDRTKAMLQLSEHQAEFEHWSNYLMYYRIRADREGPNTRPRVKVGVKVPPQPPTRQQAEVEMEEVPF